MRLVSFLGKSVWGRAGSAMCYQCLVIVKDDLPSSNSFPSTFVIPSQIHKPPAGRIHLMSSFRYWMPKGRKADNDIVAITYVQ